VGYTFVSYSSKDRDFVLRMADDLKAQGCDLWVDRWNIVGRDPFWDEIQAGIEGCSHFLFVISPDSIDRTSGAYTELLHVASLRPAPIIVPVMARATPYEKLPIVVSPGKYQIHLPYDQTVARVANTLKSNVEQTAPIEKYVKSQLAPQPPAAPEKTPTITCSIRTARIAFAIVVPLVAFAFAFTLFNQNPANTQNVEPTRGITVSEHDTPTPETTLAIVAATAVPATSAVTPPPTVATARVIPTVPPTPQGGSCVYALKSRMVVGKLGRVTPGEGNRLNDQPLRYRADGSGAKTLTTIPEGDTFVVMGGPICNDNLAWWLVNYKGRIGYTAEGNTEGYWIEPVE
jgi:hypothetical protein